MSRSMKDAARERKERQRIRERVKIVEEERERIRKQRVQKANNEAFAQELVKSIVAIVSFLAALLCAVLPRLVHQFNLRWPNPVRRIQIGILAVASIFVLLLIFVFWK